MFFQISEKERNKRKMRKIKMGSETLKIERKEIVSYFGKYLGMGQLKTGEALKGSKTRNLIPANKKDSD